MDQKLCPNCDEPVIDKIPPCPLQCGSPRCKSYKKKSMIDTSSKPIIWVLGGPGCGKGTQCEKIIEKYGFTHLSTGDLLRAEVKSGSDQAKCLASAIERGELVSTEVVLDLLKKKIEARAKTSRGFLIDGYPRERHQGEAFETVIGHVNAILFFEATADTMRQRLLGRAVVSGRIDDNEEAIEHRLFTFYQNNDMVLAQYPDRLFKINAEQSPDNIFAEVVKVLDKLGFGK